MIDPRIFIKEPVDFQGICQVYPPSIKQALTVKDFEVFTKILTITQEELEREAQKNKAKMVLTPFEFLLNCAYNNPDLRKTILRGFELYTGELAIFLYEEKQIVLGNFEKDGKNLKTIYDLRILDEYNYFNFQNLIRQATGKKEVAPPVPIDPNEDPRIRKIKEGARRRDAIKAKQGNKDGIQLSTCLVAICCMGIGITPLNIGELSYASIGPIMNMMQEKEKYDIDIRSLLAGADSKKVKPKYWIRNSD